MTPDREVLLIRKRTIVPRQLQDLTKVRLSAKLNRRVRPKSDIGEWRTSQAGLVRRPCAALLSYLLDIQVREALVHSELVAPKVGQSLPKSIVRLVYRSRSTLHPDNVEELDKIFRTSVKNNRLHRVSGCLAHPDGHFVQVIEGAAKSVDALMALLVSDRRHTDVVVLARWSASARIFSSWAMARPDLRPLEEQSFRLINEVGSGAQVTALLLGLGAQGASLYPAI